VTVLALAGLRIELHGAEPPWLLPFRRSGRGELQLRLAVRDAPAPAELGGPLVAASMGAVRGDGLRGFIGARCAELEVFGGALLPALRLVVAAWGAPRGIVLLHGACVVHRGAAHAWLGPSGAGKTTLSRLALAHLPGAAIVSDEVAAVGSGRAFAHPFHGAIEGARLADEGVPLASIAFLEHGLVTRAAPVARPGREIVRRVFAPLRDAAALRATLRAVDALASIPARRLSFAPDASAPLLAVA